MAREMTREELLEVLNRRSAHLARIVEVVNRPQLEDHEAAYKRGFEDGRRIGREEGLTGSVYHGQRLADTTSPSPEER